MSWISLIVDELRRRRAMHEMNTIIRRDTSEFHWTFKNLISDANDALEKDLRRRAVEIWEQAYAQFPTLATESDDALQLLIRLEMFDKAEELLKRSLIKHPNDSRCIEGLAQVAFKRGRPEEAFQYCEKLRRRYPGSPRSYWIAAAALSDMGRATEGEKILERGIKRMPDDQALRLEYAKLAERQGHWQDALTRWTDLYKQFDHRAGIIGIGTALSHMGRHDEAIAALSDVLYKFGNEFGVWMALARAAERKGDWDDAARRWATVRERFPISPASYMQSSEFLTRAGRLKEADDVMRLGIERTPDDPSLPLEFARQAHRIRNWAEAVHRWQYVREHFPTIREAYEREAEMLEATDRGAEASELRAVIVGH